MSSNAGPKPKRSVVSGLPPSSIGSALISTPFVMSSVSKPGSTNDGRVVAKAFAILDGVRDVLSRVVSRVVSRAGGYATGVRK
jgi:hypothetical protein